MSFTRDNHGSTCPGGCGGTGVIAEPFAHPCGWRPSDALEGRLYSRRAWVARVLNSANPVNQAAQRWLAQILDVVSHPHVACDDDEIVFDWVGRGPRQITVFFTRHDVEVIMAWGSNIETEMASALDSSPGGFAACWAWFEGGPLPVVRPAKDYG